MQKERIVHLTSSYMITEDQYMDYHIYELKTGCLIESRQYLDDALESIKKL